MEQLKDLAIVLRSIAYEERHRIVTALTERHGLVSGLARNAIQSRRFGGCLEPFTASEWRFVLKPGSELVRIEEAEIRRSFEGLRKDFERLSLAGVFSELMLKLAPRLEPCEELFRLHSNALALLEELPPSPEGEGPGQLAVLNAYLAKVLQWNGTQPRLLACQACGRKLEEIEAGEELSCLISEASWVCAKCRETGTRHVETAGTGGAGLPARLAPTAILDFRLSLAFPIRQAAAACQATRAQHRELFRFLEGLLAYHVPGFDREPLRSLRFLDLESNLRPPAGNPR
jgi:DNA repair protein RecO